MYSNFDDLILIVGDSEDERERKLLQMQEQLKRMQEQMRVLVEESMRSKARKSKQPSNKKVNI